VALTASKAASVGGLFMACLARTPQVSSCALNAKSRGSKQHGFKQTCAALDDPRNERPSV